MFWLLSDYICYQKSCTNKIKHASKIRAHGRYYLYLLSFLCVQLAGQPKFAYSRSKHLNATFPLCLCTNCSDPWSMKLIFTAKLIWFWSQGLWKYELSDVKLSTIYHEFLYTNLIQSSKSIEKPKECTHHW